MALPETVRVKLSSEGAESISITPVVSQEMPTRELVELMLGLTGKDAARIHQLLRQGSLVSGASRFRWNGWDAGQPEIEALLATFPDPAPERQFRPRECTRAVLRGQTCRIEVPREAGARRRFLRRRSLWDVLLEVTSAGDVRYLEYSYKDRADCYRVELSSAEIARVRSEARTAAYTSLVGMIETGAYDCLDLYVPR